jgi:hypothetical protein
VFNRTLPYRDKKVVGVFVRFSLPLNLNSVAEETSPNHYINTGAMPMAVLLEGNFKSMYENRVLAFEQTKFKTKGC